MDRKKEEYEEYEGLLRELELLEQLEPTLRPGESNEHYIDRHMAWLEKGEALHAAIWTYRDNLQLQ